MYQPIISDNHFVDCVKVEEDFFTFAFSYFLMSIAQRPNFVSRFVSSSETVVFIQHEFLVRKCGLVLFKVKTTPSIPGNNQVACVSETQRRFTALRVCATCVWSIAGNAKSRTSLRFHDTFATFRTISQCLLLSDVPIFGKKKYIFRCSFPLAKHVNRDGRNGSAVYIHKFHSLLVRSKTFLIKRFLPNETNCISFTYVLTREL